MKRDKYNCIICGSKKIIVVHHKNGYDWCEDGRCNPENGVTLCNNCHEEFHADYGRGNNTEKQFMIFYNKKIKNIMINAYNKHKR